MTIQITPEAVKAAYEKTGLKPVQVRFFNEKENCGCALTALAMAHDREEFENRFYTDRNRNKMFKYFEELFGWDETSLWAFVSGFDKDLSNYVDISSDTYYGIGVAVRNEIFKGVTK